MEGIYSSITGTLINLVGCHSDSAWKCSCLKVVLNRVAGARISVFQTTQVTEKNRKSFPLDLSLVLALQTQYLKPAQIFAYSRAAHCYPLFRLGCTYISRNSDVPKHGHNQFWKTIDRNATNWNSTHFPSHTASCPYTGRNPDHIPPHTANCTNVGRYSENTPTNRSYVSRILDGPTYHLNSRSDYWRHSICLLYSRTCIDSYSRSHPTCRFNNSRDSFNPA